MRPLTRKGRTLKPDLCAIVAASTPQKKRLTLSTKAPQKYEEDFTRCKNFNENDDFFNENYDFFNEAKKSCGKIPQSFYNY